MSTVIVRNKGSEARVLKEGGKKGTTVTLDAPGPGEPHSSHGCKVGEKGITISGAGALELEAGQAALVVSVLDADGKTMQETPIAAGATVGITGSHELRVMLAPDPEVKPDAGASEETVPGEAG